MHELYTVIHESPVAKVADNLWSMEDRMDEIMVVQGGNKGLQIWVAIREKVRVLLPYLNDGVELYDEKGYEVFYSR